MSATKPETEVEKYLRESAESTSMALYNKPFAELDEERQRKVMAGAHRQLKQTVLYEPEPGICFECGRDVPFKKIQCWNCHEGHTPSPKEMWLQRHRNEVQ